MSDNKNDLLFSIVEEGLQELLSSSDLVFLLFPLVLLPQMVIISQEAKVSLVITKDCRQAHMAM